MPAERRSARVTTRTGDAGETSLFGRERVAKTDPRIEALGELDEAQSVIGVARSHAPRSALGRQLHDLQRGLYLAMAEVATPAAELDRLGERLGVESLAALDAVIARVRASTRIEGRFVIPGDDRLGAALDHARTVSRRAERRVVECVVAGLVSGEILIPWLNRLSDVLFVLARSMDARARAPKRRATKAAARTTRRGSRRS